MILGGANVRGSSCNILGIRWLVIVVVVMLEWLAGRAKGKGLIFRHYFSFTGGKHRVIIIKS